MQYALACTTMLCVLSLTTAGVLIRNDFIGCVVYKHVQIIVASSNENGLISSPVVGPGDVHTEAARSPVVVLVLASGCSSRWKKKRLYHYISSPSYNMKSHEDLGSGCFPGSGPGSPSDYVIKCKCRSLLLLWEQVRCKLGFC